ncbi:DNA polymerase III subunit chi [Gammaproteobacteria bacterium]
MLRVDFYILPDATPEGRFLYACRLIEKAHGLGHPIYLHTPSASVARRMDSLLWTYRKNSFLPHGLTEDALLPVPPILIGDDRGPEVMGTPLDEILVRMHSLLCPITNVPPWEGPSAPGAVLINLASSVPSFFDRFTRVAELVDQEEQNLRAGRMRFTYYRERNISPESHKLPPNIPR